MEKEGETPLPRLTLTVTHYTTPNYNEPKTGDINDLLLLELEHHVYLDIYTPVCLPSFSHSETFSGQMATVMGWGLTDVSNVSDESNVLMEVDVPIVTNKYCAEKMNETFFKGQMCAGGEVGRDSCEV